MSCDVGHPIETQESASSQLPEGTDCRRGETGDPPISHGNPIEQLERTPLHDMSSTSNDETQGSSTSNAPDGGSRTKGKRRALDLQGSVPSDKSGSESTSVENRPRKRLSFDQKLKVLEQLEAGRKSAQVAERYGCSEATVWRIAREKGELERKKESPGFNGKAKAEMPVGFPQVDEKVKKMVEDARRSRVPVTHEVIRSFGRAVRKQLVDSNEVSAGEKERLASFCASKNWAQAFVKRHGLVSKAQQDGSRSLELEMLSDVEGNLDCCTEDDSDNKSEEKGSMGRTPEELSIILDTLDEQAVIVGSQKVQDLLQQVREALIPRSLE